MQNSSRILLSRLTAEVAASTVTLIIGAVVCLAAREHGTGWGDAGPQPGYFPFYVGLIIALASLGTLVQAVRQHRDRQVPFLTVAQGQRILAFFGPMLAFVVLAAVLGLYVGLVIYLCGVMVRQGGYRLHKALLVSVGTALACYVVFEIWFQVPLLKGPLEAWLKIH
jgi:hypothetical protein